MEEPVLVLSNMICVWNIVIEIKGSRLSSSHIKPSIFGSNFSVFTACFLTYNYKQNVNVRSYYIIIQLIICCLLNSPILWIKQQRFREWKSILCSGLEYKPRICSFKFYRLCVRSILHCLKWKDFTNVKDHGDIR